MEDGTGGMKTWRFGIFMEKRRINTLLSVFLNLLLTGKDFSSLSIMAKMLYGLLLDRMGMASKNKWLDRENRVYVIYPIAEIQQDMCISRKKAMEILSELEEKGLVEKQIRGSGLPNLLIY